MAEINLVIFILLCTLLSLVPFVKQLSPFSFYIAVVQLFLAITFLLLRDPTAATDAGNYSSMYYSTTSLSSVFQAYHGNFVFSFTMLLGRQLNLDVEDFLRIYPVFCLLLSFWGFLLLVPRRYLPVTLGYFIINPGFILLFTNVLRQGLALSFIFLGVGIYFKVSRKLAYLVFFLAIFSHFSALIVFVVFLTTIRVAKKSKQAYKIGKTIMSTALLTPIIACMTILLSSLFPSILFSLGSLGGLFSKVSLYIDYGYDSKVFYIKLITTYVISLINLFILNKFAYSKTNDYIFSLFVQLLLLMVCVSLAVPLISSRLLYYPELLISVPIVNTYKALIKKTKFAYGGSRFFLIYLFLLTTATVGSFVYLFPSIRANTGF